MAVAHLSADGTAALAGACVDIKVEEDTGFRHFQVGVSIHSSFQPLEAPKYHKSMPGSRERESLTLRLHRIQSPTPCTVGPSPCPKQHPPEAGQLGRGHIGATF